MTCPACAKATREPCHDFEMDCLGCAARAVARSHQRSVRCGRLTAPT
jgi:hypothetical protein